MEPKDVSLMNGLNIRLFPKRKNMKTLEQAILTKATQILNSMAETLSRVNLSWKGPELEVWCNDESNYTSEISITFLRDGNIDDVLEFHVFKNGACLVNEEEVETWLRRELKKLTS
jgi:hypothetical protein